MTGVKPSFGKLSQLSGKQRNRPQPASVSLLNFFLLADLQPAPSPVPPDLPRSPGSRFCAGCTAFGVIRPYAGKIWIACDCGASRTARARCRRSPRENPPPAETGKRVNVSREPYPCPAHSPGNQGGRHAGAVACLPFARAREDAIIRPALPLPRPRPPTTPAPALWGAWDSGFWRGRRLKRGTLSAPVPRRSSASIAPRGAGCHGSGFECGGRKRGGHGVKVEGIGCGLGGT